MSTQATPRRGEVWMAEFGPVRGHEQTGRRPALVISIDLFNSGPTELAIAIPITTKYKRTPFHVACVPPEGGLREESFIKCEDVRSLSKDRLTRRLGAVFPLTLAAVEDRLRILLGL